MSLPYISKITALRALSIIAVVIFHLGYMPFGYFGVDIFFFISGYLIVGIIRSGDLTFSKFIIRRVKRILPPLLLIVIVMSILVFALNKIIDKSLFFGSILSSIGFYSNIFFLANIDYWSPDTNKIYLIHLWSTSVEMQFYVIAGIFILKIRSYEKEKNIFIILLCLILMSLYFYNKSYSEWFYLPLSRIWEFYLGGYFFVLNEKNIFKKVKVNKLNLLTLLNITILIIVLSGLLKNTISVFLMQIILLISCGLILIVPTDSKFFKTFIESKVIKRVGITSYSLYLWHQPVLAILKNYEINVTGWVLLAYLIGIYILSELSYKFIEQPFQKNNNETFKRFKYVIALTLCTYMTILFIQKIQYYKSINDGKENNDNKKYISYVESGFNNQSKNIWNDEDKFKILIIGDSYAMDFYNILMEGNLLQYMSVLTYFINMGCQNVPNDIDYERFILPENKNDCKNIARVGDDKLNKLIKESDGVIVASKWTEYTAQNVPLLLKKFNLLKMDNVIIVGRKEFLKELLIHDYKNNTNQKFYLKSSQEYINVIEKLKSYNIKNYIDMHSLYCISSPNYSCPLYTDNGNTISFDGNHLTQSGAIYLANILVKDENFKKIWNEFKRKK